jgi:hypothetical protein
MGSHVRRRSLSGLRGIRPDPQCHGSMTPSSAWPRTARLVPHSSRERPDREAPSGRSLEEVFAGCFRPGSEDLINRLRRRVRGGVAGCRHLGGHTSGHSFAPPAPPQSSLLGDHGGKSACTDAIGGKQWPCRHRLGGVDGPNRYLLGVDYRRGNTRLALRLAHRGRARPGRGVHGGRRDLQLHCEVLHHRGLERRVGREGSPPSSPDGRLPRAKRWPAHSTRRRRAPRWSGARPRRPPSWSRTGPWRHRSSRFPHSSHPPRRHARVPLGGKGDPLSGPIGSKQVTLPRRSTGTSLTAQRSRSDIASLGGTHESSCADRRGNR